MERPTGKRRVTLTGRWNKHRSAKVWYLEGDDGFMYRMVSGRCPKQLEAVQLGSRITIEVWCEPWRNQLGSYIAYVTLMADHSAPPSEMVSSEITIDLPELG